MKRSIGVLSMIVMTLTQVFSPFVYAVTGEAETIETPTPVVEDEKQGQASENLEKQEVEQEVQPEAQPETGTQPKANPEDSVVGEINSGNNEVLSGKTKSNPQPENESGDVKEETSGGITELSGEGNYKYEEQNLEGSGNETNNGSGTESGLGFIESLKEGVKNMLGLGNSEEKEVEENIESKEIYGTGEYNGVKVEVYAATGLFASGTELTIQPVTGSKIEEVKEVLSGEVKMVEEEQKQTVVAFDITFRDQVTKEELQPKNGIVQVTFNYEDNTTLKQAEENEEQEVKVYHLNDIDEEGEKIEEITGTKVEELVINEEECVEKNIIVVEAESFSIYTIVTQVKEEGPQTTKDQLANFEYGMISIARPSSLSSSQYPIEGFTIMDRNLGAQMIGSGENADPKSYGYHYQWGNNYGFDSSITNLYSNHLTGNKIKVDVISGYSSKIFVTGGNTWMETNIDTLWGGANGSTITDKQGPCPEGWHVPSGTEWSLLIKYWGVTNGVPLDSWYYKNIHYYYLNSNYSDFQQYFKLPLAGYRDSSAKLLSTSAGGFYRTSSPSSAGGNIIMAVYLTKTLAGSNSQTGRASGYNVRCFKDTFQNTDVQNLINITFDYRGGKGSTASINVISGGKATMPSDPIRAHSLFSGWYISGTNIEFNFTGKKITENISLYAKYHCDDGYMEAGNYCREIIDVTCKANGGLFENNENEKVYHYASGLSLNNQLLENPIQEGYEFLGWYESGKNEYYDFTKPLIKNVELYAKWYNENEIEDELTSTIISGSNFNKIIKTLANNEEVTSDAKIKNIKRVGEMPDGVNKVLISTVESDSPIYVWFNEGDATIYLYSKSKTIYINEDASGMFLNLTELKKLDILNSLNAQNVKNMFQMFNGCSSLESIDLKGMKLNNVETMESMLAGCSSLESIDMKGMKLPKVKTMASMFGGATNLSKIDMSYFEAPELLNISSMFGGAALKTIKMDHMIMPKLQGFSAFGGLNKLQNIDLSYTDIRSVESLGGLFGGCSNLEKVDMHNLIASGATTISYMFGGGNSSLMEVDMSNVDIRNVRDMSSLFNGANSLEKVNFNGMIANKIENMSSMFNGCTNLETIDVSMLNTSKVTSMTYMFSSCIKLRSIKMDGWDLRSLSSASSAGSFFSGTPALRSVSASGWKLPTNFTDWISRSWYASMIEEIDVTNWNLSGTTNISGLFGSSPFLKKIKGIDTWTGMNSLENISNMFNSCNSLEEIDVSHLDTSKVTSMYSMFSSCPKLKSVKMDGWDLRNLSSASSAGSFFSSSSALKSISASGWKLPTNFTDWISRSWSASMIEEIDVTNWNLSGTSNISGLFGSSTFLKKIKGLNTWTGMNSLTNISQMFANCTKLTELDLSNWDTSKVTSMSNLCGGCTKLKSIKMDGWNFRSISSMDDTNGILGNTPLLSSISASGWKLPSNFNDWIKNWNALTVEELNVTNWNLSGTENLGGLFAGASKLKTIKGMDSWTETSQIWNTYQMFNGCKSLTDVDLSGIESDNIRKTSEMFKGASKLKTIYVTKDFQTGDISDDNGTGMFDLSISLVGGNGTIYNSNKTNQEYAVIDDETHPGYFTNILDKPYTITYILNGGSLSGEKTSYTQRTGYELPQPTRAGYIFKGWTGSNGKTPEKEVTTEGKKGNLEYTANWELIVEPSKPTNTGGGGGGSSNTEKKVIENKTIEKEHESAEVKEENQEINQSEKPTTKTEQTEKGTSSSSKTVQDPEILSAYERAYKHSVTTMPTLEEAMPDRTVKRGHLAKMVVNYATSVLGQEIPEKIPSECRWNDRKTDWESEEIKDYAVKSCALGLMGLDMDKFLPNMEVTRAQFGTIMSRLLWGKRYAGGKPYYKNHLDALKENNIMTQIENPEKRVELRQWVWLMLMRSAENK